MTIRLSITPWKPKRTNSWIETIIFIEGAILLASDQYVSDGIAPGSWRWCIKITSSKCPNVERHPRSCQPTKLIKYTAPGLTAIQKLLQVHETCLIILEASSPNPAQSPEQHGHLPGSAF